MKSRKRKKIEKEIMMSETEIIEEESEEEFYSSIDNFKQFEIEMTGKEAIFHDSNILIDKIKSSIKDTKDIFDLMSSKLHFKKEKSRMYELLKILNENEENFTVDSSLKVDIFSVQNY
jgi:hypothetical protein